MIVLGINAFGYSPSACLVRDGKLVAFCQEERLTRLKGSHGLFPSLTVSWCLKSQNLNLHDIDYIAFSWGCKKHPWKMIKHLAKKRIKLMRYDTYYSTSSINQKSNSISAFEHIYLYSPSTVVRNIRDNLRLSGHKGAIPPIEFVEHHISHAFQTFYQSSFKKASVLIADGSGEENCVSGYLFDENSYHKIFGFDIPQSLGWYYSGFTSYLGFKPIRDEGKMMGLAAYGEKRKENNKWLEIINKILKITNDGFELDPTFFKFGGNEYHPRFTDKLTNFITSHNQELQPISINEYINLNGKILHKYLLDNYIDLAYAVQTRLEEALTSLVNSLIDKTNVNNLCLAGGIFMNCKANSFILDNTDVDNIFIHPASSDDGSCIGAAFYISKEMGYQPRNILESVQLGPSFNNKEVEKIIKTCKLSYSTPDDICYEMSKLIASGKMIGWFQGGCEMGARALGGRSIIASPIISGVRTKINEYVKRREQWRPYCPSINYENKEDYLKESLEAPYMILARQASEKLIKAAPDTVHIDGTVRPQTVQKSVLTRWHRLIENVGQLTGHPIILNTSLNVRGEPIACQPYDAINYLFSTGLDALAIEDFLIAKKI